jgi:hypothetical protein
MNPSPVYVTSSISSAKMILTFKPLSSSKFFEKREEAFQCAARAPAPTTAAEFLLPPSPSLLPPY